MRIKVLPAVILLLVTRFGDSVALHQFVLAAELGNPTIHAPAGTEHAVPIEAPPRKGLSPVQKAANLNQQVTTINEQYQQLLKDWNRFLVIRKQQPENRQVHLNYLSKLNQHLELLRQSVAPSDSGPNQVGGPASSSETAKPTGKVAVVEPGGATSSVHTPPSKQEIERLITALDKTHLPGRPLQPKRHAAADLSRVPPQWVDRLAGAATGEVQRVSQLLGQPVINEQKVQLGLDRLQMLLREIANPPLDSETTEPKPR